MNNKLKRGGTLFWITGLSGSGKTTIAEPIKREISKKYGPTITVSGDDLRELFYFKKSLETLSRELLKKI